MHSGRPALIERLFGSPPHGSDLADSSGFLQGRVRLYARAGFTFLSVATGIGLLKWAVMPVSLLDASNRDVALVLLAFAVPAILYGLAWFYLHKAPRPALASHLIESVGTVVLSAAIGSGAYVMPVGIPQTGLFLSVVLVLVIRAGLVPSTPARTILVGVLSTSAMAIPMHLRGMQLEDTAVGFERYMAGYAIGWGLFFALGTAFVSRVIYGLHTRVREAMRLGNYTLKKKLGEGGMGEVYLADHALLKRPTAVKLLPPERAGETNVARFEREVVQTSRLTHPNTVAVYDFGRTPDGVFYYAMEYLDGLDLEELVDQYGPQPGGRVIYILAQAAHALAEAHAAGLVHRDIKPANILIADRGGVADMAKVVDFGLVKDLESGTDAALSKTGAITGTPLFIAPESLTDPDTVGPRSDLYSLGAVGYFLLTGKPVFEGRTVVEVCGHHMHSEPEPPSRSVDVAPDLEKVILQCLAKDPKARPVTALELRRALLSCQVAAAWDMDEATRWWALHGDRVREFRMDRRKSVPATQNTIAVAPTEPSSRSTR
jgi:eukaryotic-like serine/threonine-protein kinase